MFDVEYGLFDLSAQSLKNNIESRLPNHFFYINFGKPNQTYFA